MGILDFKIGFLTVSLFDLLDILIVGYLLYQLYKLLRGSIALNIFFGLFLLYLLWGLVTLLDMSLLSGILNQFVNVGVIALIIIFQPEVRRFLLFLGNRTIQRQSSFLERLLNPDIAPGENRKQEIEAIVGAMLRMSRRRTGALIVLTKGLNLDGIVSGGTYLHADISEGLIESVFNKSSPLHDGAMLLNVGKIQAVSVVLPVSESQSLPKSAGLRHRAAVGLSERTNTVAFIVSEETGAISFSAQGHLERKLEEERVRELLEGHY